MAKAQGAGILLLMAVVALTVHFWPRRGPEAVPAPKTTLGAPATPARVLPNAPQPQRHTGLRMARVAAPRPTPAVPVALPSPRPADHVGTSDTLASLPGSHVSLPAVEPLGVAKRPGAVTRAAQSTGKALAGAFKKTGSVFRRAF